MSEKKIDGCCGDCPNCELLHNGQTDPARCASVWGFVHVKSMYAEMRQMRDEIRKNMELISSALSVGVLTIPGIVANEVVVEPAEEVAQEESGNTPTDEKE